MNIMSHIFEGADGHISDETNSAPLVEGTEHSKHTGGDENTDRREVHELLK